ncbi:hypothetical protein PUN28_004659 [Cardiocondyla obscurior]|uniref:Uncharacterized protein n=1 Tax=Cardiocondyla obscurior TaxID=286306 RepID=A0AAW2GDU6_9HYME
MYKLSCNYKLYEYKLYIYHNLNKLLKKTRSHSNTIKNIIYT